MNRASPSRLRRTCRFWAWALLFILFCAVFMPLRPLRLFCDPGGDAANRVYYTSWLSPQLMKYAYSFFINDIQAYDIEDGGDYPVFFGFSAEIGGYLFAPLALGEPSPLQMRLISYWTAKAYGLTSAVKYGLHVPWKFPKIYHTDRLSSGGHPPGETVEEITQAECDMLEAVLEYEKRTGIR